MKGNELNVVIGNKKTRLLPLVIDGVELTNYFECQNCKHRVTWGEDKLETLRYCWFCGKKFEKD